MSSHSIELRADGAHWPSSMQKMLVSPIFADEPLVQIQYLKIKLDYGNGPIDLEIQ